MDNAVWVSMAITVVLQAIKDTTKDKKRKKELKAALLKVRNAINTVYADDPDFQ